VFSALLNVDIQLENISIPLLTYSTKVRTIIVQII